jgi:hypothetical protein
VREQPTVAVDLERAICLREELPEQHVVQGKPRAYAVSQANGVWGTAKEIPGTAALNKDGHGAADSARRGLRRGGRETPGNTLLPSLVSRAYHSDITFRFRR